MTYLLEYPDKESKDCEDGIVGSEGIGDADNDHRPLTDEKDRLATELVRQSTTNHCSKHHADDEYCLCEVLEIGTITDQVPLQTEHVGSVAHLAALQ